MWRMNFLIEFQSINNNFMFFQLNIFGLFEIFSVEHKKKLLFLCRNNKNNIKAFKKRGEILL